MFKNPAAEFVYYRTYSRWLPEEKRRETWPETVDRVISFLKEERGSLVPEKVFRKIKKGMLAFEVLPSMRLVWSAGKAAKASNVALYNCSFLPVDSIEAFAECLYILCSGTGVGFSVEKKYISKLPVVPPIDITYTPRTCIVGDSKEGWSDSLKILISSLYLGQDVIMDYSRVRPKGTPLKTMGGRASGPEPLIVLHSFIKDIFAKAQGRKLTTLEVNDIMNKIAEIVVVGGVRRSSQISLSDLDDIDIQTAKNWPFPPHRHMSNNSAVYYSKPTAAEFLKEWANLAMSGTGERGISNIGAARASAPQRRQGTEITGTNPCQPAWATVLTPNGIRTLGDINIGDTIWSGKEWTEVVNKWSTGVKKVYKYQTSGGIFYGTENHRVFSNGKKVEASEAESIDAAVGSYRRFNEWDPQDVMDGLVFGDGAVHKASNNLVYLYIGSKDHDYFTSEISHLIKKDRSISFGPGAHEIETTLEYTDVCKTYDRVIPERFYYGSYEKKAGFLRGLFTANGCVTANRVQYKCASAIAAKQIQEMLSSMGMRSSLVVNKPKEIQHHNGTYISKESYNIILYNSSEEYMDSIGFLQKYKAEKTVKNSTPRTSSSPIREIEFISEEEVFDITVDCDDHSYWTGGCLVSNCGEIMLRSNEFCNLSTVVVQPDDEVDDLLDKIETATWIGAIQATFTDFPYLRPVWKENCDEERLLGVSLSGQFDNPDLLTEDVLKALKAKAIKVAKKASNELGINMPAAITCTKPEGTTSQLTFSGSGAHPWFAPYYIRRYRISGSDPLFKMMLSQGFVFTPENGQTQENATTWVVSFPCKAPKTAKFRNEVGAMDQLRWYKKLQDNWCEHNASITVYVKDHEWFDVGNWVYNNWEACVGVSFLPYDGGKYQQAPYEEITEDQYNKMIKSFPEIDYSQLHLFENTDLTDGAQTYACVGDKCEIK